MKAAFGIWLTGCFILASCTIPKPLDALRPVPDAEAVGVTHVVVKGDTLYSICRKYHADCQEVAEVNGIEDQSLIRTGQRVFIPDAAGSMAKTRGMGKSGEVFQIQHWKGMFIWPVEGVLTTRFGIRHGRRHDGIDIAAPEGTKIKASADGRAVYTGDQQTGYGNLIILRHQQNMLTIYAHNQQHLVSTGDFVKKGQIIATVGKTGRASGPHLHFEIRNGVKPRNPLFFLPKTM